MVSKRGQAVTLPHVPPNKLPEGSRYPDTGCAVSASCFRCPLPHCKYDVATFGTEAQYRRAKRDAQIVAMRDTGMEIKAIARRFGISKRTTSRAVSPVGREECRAIMVKWNRPFNFRAIIKLPALLRNGSAP